MFRAQNFQQTISNVIPPTQFEKFIVLDQSQNLYVVDIATESLLNTYNIPELGSGYSCAAGNGVIAITNYGGAKVDFVDALTFAYLGNTPVGDYGWGVDYADGKFWVACAFNTSDVYVIDATTFSVITTLTDVVLPQGVSYGNGKIAVSSYTAPTTSNGIFDNSTNSLITTVAGGNNMTSVGYGDGKFLLASYIDNNVTIVNAVTNSIIATISVGTNPYGDKIAYGDGYFAVGNFNSSNVSIIQSSTNTVVSTVNTPASPFNVAYGNGKFGVTVNSSQLSFIDSTSHVVLSSLNIGSSIFAICAI